ncbi:mechanosensitive ion channel family protein [Rhodococcus sp. X156]|uniref:mechanosensitive ion channel family protein n=1 Tax=Rhodococcus sp. X156 TaxID=2499145 RepID=UPI0019D048BB|nr:mechanosensitive ion channel family protein [Rhodococcus sp. X156]
MRVQAIAPLGDITTWLRSSGLLIVLYVLGAILLARFVSWVGQRITDHIDDTSGSSDALVRSEQSKHRHAVAQVITWIAIVLLYCLTAVLVLDALGIPITGLVAPATVLGVALGFGAQRVVQDLLAGFFIIAERQYGFGDVVRISAVGSVTGVTGTVEDVSLRVTRLRSADGEVVIVPNGQVVQVTNLSRDWARAVVDVPLPPSVDITVANEVLHQVGADMYQDPDFQPLLLDEPSVMGVESFTVEQTTVRMVARTLPGRQFEVGRQLRVRVAVALRQHGINVSAAELEAPAAAVRGETADA